MFNIAGGETWQMLGREYIEKICKIFSIPPDREYSKEFTWLDWYDTIRSQAVLDYQHVSSHDFLSDLKKAVTQLYE